MSILVSILTVVFILFLLRLERKQNPIASYSLWIPTIWLLFYTSRSLAVWLGYGSDNLDEGNVTDRVFEGMFLIIGLLILIKRRFNWIKGIKDNPWLFLLIGFMLLSVLWSDMPFVTFKRWIRGAFLPIVMAFIVATEVDPSQALKSLFRRIIYVHIPLSLLLTRFYPFLGVQFGRWTGDRFWVGVSSQKNGLALICLFAIFFLLWTLMRKRRGLDVPVTWYQAYIEVFILILSIWLFMGPRHTLTYSSTSLASLVIGLTALWGLKWLKRFNIILGVNFLSIIICLIIIYGTYTPFVGGLTIVNPSELLGRSETLTERTDHIWALLIPYVMQEPFLGYGYRGFWTSKLVKTIYNNAHNGYLDSILDIGFTGLMLLSIFLIASCRKAHREMMQDFDWGVFWFCIVLMLVVHNIAESSIGKFTGLMIYVLLFSVSSQSKEIIIKNTS